MYSDTLCPGNWPPSPGLAPCAILIWIWSALARYSAVTPNRPEATCLIFERSESPSLSARSRSTFCRPRRNASVSPAFASVGLAADAVHCDGECGVRLGRDRTQRHGASGETLDDLLCRFDFLDRDRLPLAELELEQAAESHVPLRLVVDNLRVFPVGLETPLLG